MHLSAGNFTSWGSEGVKDRLNLPSVSVPQNATLLKSHARSPASLRECYTFHSQQKKNGLTAHRKLIWFTGYKTILLIHCVNYMVCHLKKKKRERERERACYIIKNIAPTTHVFVLPKYDNPLAQTAVSHSLPNIPPFYPSFIVPASLSLAVACCVYLPC